MRIDVRMYHVGFGDCFLVTFSDTEEARTFRMLFDCGRHAGSKPTDVDAGETTFEDTVKTLIEDIEDNDHVPRLDVIVVTHRHRDHVHGFRYKQLWKRVEVKEVWLPWVEDTGNPFAAKLKARQQQLALRTFHALRALAKGADAVPDEHKEAVEIAYNSTTNAAAMSTLMDGGFGDPQPRLRFLPRLGREPDRIDGGGDILPRGLTVRVLGPSRDPRVIKLLDPPSGKTYHELLPADSALPAAEEDSDPEPDIGDVPTPFPESWIATTDEYAFEDDEAAGVPGVVQGALLEPLELVYRLDNALNGTSLVILLEAAERRLLFPGDAQWGTWQYLLEDTEIRPLLDDISFYKVGHHGSHNATPIEFVTDCLAKESTVAAMISVGPTNYKGGWQHIPLGTLVDELGEHAQEVVRADEATTPPVDDQILPTYTEREITGGGKDNR